MSVHLPLPNSIASWPTPASCDGSWACRTGPEYPIQMPDGQLGGIELLWCDDTGFIVNAYLPRLNVVSGEKDHLYDLRLETVRIEEVRILRDLLSELLVTYDGLQEEHS